MQPDEYSRVGTSHTLSERTNTLSLWPSWGGVRGICSDRLPALLFVIRPELFCTVATDTLSCKIRMYHAVDDIFSRL
jgi:hypothetical protein